MTSGEMTTTILHLIPSLEVGGSETLLLDLVRGTRDAPYQHVVVSMIGEGALVETFRDEGVPVHSLGMARARPDLRALARFRAILRAERPAVVQAWMYHANLLALVSVSWLRSAPRVIWCLHAVALDGARLSLLTRLTISLGARLSRHPAAVVANSEATRDYHAALGYRPRQWSIIYNGIDVRRFAPDVRACADVRAELGLSLDTKLVGLFARWDPMKDHGTFLRAAARLAASDPSTHFVLAGQGITLENGELRRLLNTVAPTLAARVHLLGLRRDMPRLNAALTVAAVTSSSESFCLAAAEAMASGVPCVVTNLTFLPTLVGDSGMVVPRGDAEGVAAAIHHLLNLSEEERRDLGALARQRIVKDFTLEAMIARYRALYDRVLDVVRPSGPGLSAGLGVGGGAR